MNTFNLYFLRFAALAILMTFGTALTAQTDVTESGNKVTEKPRDGFYDRYLYEEKRVLDYDFIHEKDVFWERRIWRKIYMKEKANHLFQYEEMPFAKIILTLAAEGDVTMYQPDSDKFETEMSQEEAQGLLVSSDSIETFDSETFEQKTEVVTSEINYADITTLGVKEVWFFDEEASQLDVRILGISIYKNEVDANGNPVGEINMGWVYYPEIREQLARHEAFNPHNDAARMSWEDVFEARMFSSWIIKESNVFNRRISGYKKDPVGQLLESDKIQQKIFHFEHDLWSY